MPPNKLGSSARNMVAVPGVGRADWVSLGCDCGAAGLFLRSKVGATGEVGDGMYEPAEPGGGPEPGPGAATSAVGVVDDGDAPGGIELREEVREAERACGYGLE